MLNIVLNVLYPRRCPVCDEIIALSDKDICRECRKKLTYVKAPYCMKCGKPIICEEQELCRDCALKKHNFKRGFSVFVYNNEHIKKSIYRFKYKNRREYADFYVKEIVRVLHKQIKELQADAIIPVPLHKSKIRQRGFNQAEILARGIGREMNIPVFHKIIKRCIKTIPQKELNHIQRQNNLKKAFKIVRNDVKLNTVIVVDDIYTTGSTMDSVAEELRKIGIRHIYFITLSIGCE